MTLSSKTTTVPVLSEPSRSVSIAELTTSFPGHSLTHEIKVWGGFNWATLASIGEALGRSRATLESFTARRYGDKGELMICRVKNLDDASLHNAVDVIRTLTGVQGVTVGHLLSSRRARSGTDANGAALESS